MRAWKITLLASSYAQLQICQCTLRSALYREYNPDSAGTRRDECLVGDSRRQVLVDGDKDIEVVQEKAERLRSEPSERKNRIVR